MRSQHELGENAGSDLTMIVYKLFTFTNLGSTTYVQCIPLYNITLKIYSLSKGRLLIFWTIHTSPIDQIAKCTQKSSL